MFAPTTATGHVADATALVGRLAVGIVFILHGWPKLTGFAGTTEMFAGMGLPLPQAAAALAVLIELGGGIALALGLLLPVAGIALAAQMVAAYALAHVGQPLVSADGGPAFELVLVLGATALALGFNGGRYSLDRLLPWGKPRAAASGAAADTGTDTTARR